MPAPSQPANPDRFLTAEAVAGARGPLVSVEVNAEGAPVAATAALRVEATRERLWAVVSDVQSYTDRVPMLSKVRVDGDRVTVSLRFRVALFSAGFEFVADATRQEGHWLELNHVSGEPRGLRIRFELESLPDGATLVRTGIGFDVMSLGWLTKFFLKHHPEIQFGIIPGSAIALAESMRRAVAPTKK